MRVLIVGGGIAGLTLAAKLRQQGRQPLVIERSAEYGDVGYGLGLYPLGSCVLHGLGLYEQFVARGLECRHYEVVDQTDRTLQRMDMSVVTNNAGPLIMISRADLMELLRQACGDVPIRMGTTVTKVESTENGVGVRLSDGSEHSVDLVVACDGIDSPLRSEWFGEQETFDTGWTLWTWWGREGLPPGNLVRERWGRGLFFGAYPLPGRCMFGAAFPTDQGPAPSSTPDACRSLIRKRFDESAAHAADIGRALDDAETFFPWPMKDVRSRHWYRDRLVLCGDAAAAFLPTAGVGASVALRSAAALADELSKTDATHLPLALERYERRCRAVAERNQDDSRAVARYMFVASKPLGWGRDRLMRFYPAKRLVKNIIESMREPF